MTLPRIQSLAALLVLWTLAAATPCRLWGLINLNFTPVEMVKAAESIVVLTGTPDAQAKRISFTLVKVLKGKDAAIASADAADVMNDESLAKCMESKSVPVLLFTGFQKAKGGGDDTAAVVHIGTSWFGIVGSAKDGYALADDKMDLKAVWDGGTTPLEQCAAYILASKTPIVRAVPGVTWSDIAQHGKVAGAGNSSATAIDANGRPEVLIASSKGDLIVTALADGSLKTTVAASKSTLVTYADVDQDGKLDRIGCDGKTLYSLADPSKPVSLGELKEAPALGIGQMSVEGKPALLVTLAGGPICMVRHGERLEARQLIDKPLAGARVSRVFDVDGDHVPDLVIVTGDKLLVAKGSKTGFAALTAVAALADIEVRDLHAADFDADGHIDLLLTGPAKGGLCLLVGDGHGGFRPVLEESGELAYHGEGKIGRSLVGDFNADGLVDVVLLPVVGPPKLMFNRGFRTFGYSRELDFGTLQLANKELLTGQEDPVTIAAGELVDLGGKSGGDLLLAAGGKLVVARLQAQRGSAIGVRARLAPGQAGPVTLTAVSADRALGGYVVDAARPVFLGMPGKGLMQLTLTFPDGSSRQEKLFVTKPTDFMVGGAPSGSGPVPVAQP